MLFLILNKKKIAFLDLKFVYIFKKIISTTKKVILLEKKLFIANLENQNYMVCKANLVFFYH